MVERCPLSCVPLEDTWVSCDQALIWVVLRQTNSRIWVPWPIQIAFTLLGYQQYFSSDERKYITRYFTISTDKSMIWQWYNAALHAIYQPYIKLNFSGVPYHDIGKLIYSQNMCNGQGFRNTMKNAQWQFNSTIYAMYISGEHLLRMWYLLRNTDGYRYTNTRWTKRLDTYEGNPPENVVPST